MKASLELRDDRSPLLRAKLPLTALGLPFLSAFSAGDPQDLGLDLSTAFDAGPIIRLSYRPRDPRFPFSLAVKMGIGAHGSPIDAPVTMCAEFNPLGWGGGGSPFFSIVFKPRLGDFSLKKVTRSAPGAPPPPVGFAPGDQQNGFPDGKQANGFAPGVASVGGASGLLSGTELHASSVLPLRSRTALRFRWGVRLPAELHTAFGQDGVSFRRLPQLVTSKISIEHMVKDNKAVEQKTSGKMTEAWPAVKQQVEALRAENEALRMDVQQLRAKVFARRQAPASGGAEVVRDWKGVERGGKVEVKAPPLATATENRDRRIEVKSPVASVKARTEDVNEELKKALMAATAGK